MNASHHCVPDFRMTANDIEIALLADVPQHGPLAMKWVFGEWGSRSGSLEEARSNAPRYANRDQLPIMFIATVGREPAGCVVLRATDLAGWENVGPWLASLFVRPEYRGRGIGAQLTRFVEKVATDLGYRSLYLFTPDAQRLYERLGWETVAEVPCAAGRAWVMLRRLAGGQRMPEVSSSGTG